MADSTNGASPTPPLTPRLRGWALASVLASLMLTLFLAALDQTIVATALKTILTSFGKVDNYTWPVVAYLLTSTAMIPVIGKLSDMFGRKVFMIPAVVIFLAGSALCGATPEIATALNHADPFWLFVVFRAVQGIGGGALMSLVFTSIGDIFVPAERARWQGLFTAVFALASVVGPTLGGYITDNVGWQWIFYINVPIGIAALFLLTFYFPTNVSARTVTAKGWAGLKRVDWAGAVTSTAAAVCFILALTLGGHQAPNGFAWNSPQIIGLLVAAGVLLLAFLLVERFAATEPILPLDLFKNQVFSAGALLALLVGTTLFAVVFYLPLFIQIVLRQTATSSGVVITPLTLSLAVAAALGGFLVARLGRYQFLSILGAVVVTLGVFMLTRMDATTSLLEVSRNMIVIGIGLGMMQPVMTLAVQNAIPRARLGVGTGAVTYLRSMGQLLGVAIIGSVVNNSFSSYLSQHLPAGIANLPASQRSRLTDPDIMQNVLADPNLQQTVKQAALTHADQTVIPQAVKQAVDAAVAQATASVPPGPQHDAIVAQITRQVTDQVTAQATPAITAQVHQQVIDLFTGLFTTAKDAFTAGLHQGFVLALVACVALFVVSLFLKDVPLIAHYGERDKAAGQPAGPEPAPVIEPIGL
jgi:EmrB/QacA subfamily drug resistance transporter